MREKFIKRGQLGSWLAGHFLLSFKSRLKNSGAQLFFTFIKNCKKSQISNLAKFERRSTVKCRELDHSHVCCCLLSGNVCLLGKNFFDWNQLAWTITWTCKNTRRLGGPTVSTNWLVEIIVLFQHSLQTTETTQMTNNDRLLPAAR